MYLIIDTFRESSAVVWHSTVARPLSNLEKKFGVFDFLSGLYRMHVKRYMRNWLCSKLLAHRVSGFPDRDTVIVFMNAWARKLQRVSTNNASSDSGAFCSRSCIIVFFGSSLGNVLSDERGCHVKILTLHGGKCQ